jgi:hypothetical protein
VEQRRILLLGATGYTGQRVLRELLARGQAPTLVGRTRTKMLALADRLQAQLPVAEVEVTSTTDLARLLEPSDVVLSTVGPFMQLGMATVTAAAQAGAHYLDSSGEGSFVRRVFALDAVAAARDATGLEAWVLLACFPALIRVGEPWWYQVWIGSRGTRPGLRGLGGATLEGPVGTTTATGPLWRWQGGAAWLDVRRPASRAQLSSCLGDNCPYSALTVPVGSRQLRLGRDSAQRGLVGCSRAWWNGCETARGSVMIRAAIGGSGRDSWND